MPESSVLQPVDQFNLSPLIRITLLTLYGALLVPLPFLAIATHAPVPPWILGIGIMIGAVLLYAALTERVVVNEQQIQVTYPQWVPTLWRRGWTLNWSDITALKPRSTGQGGIVYYFLAGDDRAYLLPMRVAGFAQLVRYVQAKTHLPMRDVKPLAQPWMYFILLGFSLLFWLFDGWVIWMSLTMSAGIGVG
ncbi:MAG: hypothetical protein F6K30_04795 [Cyanothece sp. SIO2G6]|nr:hypothetical protein [Cyanothece sp. SIO2G6]